MTTNKKWAAVIAAGTVLAMLLNANGPLGGFWGAEQTVTEPPAGALAGLVGASFIESIAFGAGIAWIVFGWSLIRTASRPFAIATYAAIGWALLSWAPHTSFHISLAENNWSGLVAVEWAFHVTLVIAALVAATFVWRTLRTDNANTLHTLSTPVA